MSGNVSHSEKEMFAKDCFLISSCPRKTQQVAKEKEGRLRNIRGKEGKRKISHASQAEIVKRCQIG